MMVNFATEDATVEAAIELPGVPSKDDEVEIGTPPVVYTVARVRWLADGTLWCLVEPETTGGSGGGKKPKKPHPWKEK